MNVRHLTTAARLLAVSVTTVSAQGNNDSVNYEPRVKTVAGTLPVDAHYNLVVSAPTQLRMKPCSSPIAR